MEEQISEQLDGTQSIGGNIPQAEDLATQGIPSPGIPDNGESDGDQAPAKAELNKLSARQLNNEIIPALTTSLNEFLLLTSHLSGSMTAQARKEAEIKQENLKAGIDAVLHQLGLSEIV